MTREVTEGVHRRLGTPSFDAMQVQRQATLLQMISITEAYCVDRLLEVAERKIEPEQDPVRASVWEEASRSAISNWKSIQKAFKDWHNVTADWKRFEGLIEVRNAIAHGLGYLTPLQRRKRTSIRTLIGRTTVRLDGDRVVLEESDMEDALQICSDLVTEIDAALMNS